MTELTMKKRSEIHLTRRFWHVLAGLVVLMPYFVWGVNLVYLGLFGLFFAAFGFYFDFKRQKDVHLNQKLQNIFMPIIRTSEVDGFSGIPFYSLGVAVSALLFNEHIAVLSILFLIFADPIASIVGVYFGRGRLFPNKTLEGTIASFVVCFLVVIIYFETRNLSSEYLVVFALIAALAGSIAELLSAFNIDDNFTIPVVSGGVMTLFYSLFPVF